MQQIDQGRLLASIASTSHDCILSIDVDGTVLWASPATVGVLGWRPEDLAGSDISLVVTRLGADLYEEHLSRLLAGEQVAPFVDEIVRRDGGTIKASVTLGPVHDADGAVSGITMILRDVSTEVRQRRQSVAGPPGLEGAFGRRSGATSIVLDADLRLTYVAPAVARLLGRSPDALVADSWQDAVHLDDAAEIGRVLLRVVAEPWRTERVVVRLRDVDGRWRPVEHVVTNHLGDSGVLGLVVVLRDLYEEVRTEEALRLSGALHRAIVETAQEGILALGENGSTSFANDRIAEILGLPVADLYGIDTMALLGLARWESETGRVEVCYTDPGGRDRVLELKRCPADRSDVRRTRLVGHRRRRHGGPTCRVDASSAGTARCVDRPSEPLPLPRPAGDRCGAARPLCGARHGAAVRRPRRVQVDQRRTRARGGRRAAPGGRRPVGRRGPEHRHRRAGSGVTSSRSSARTLTSRAPCWWPRRSSASCGDRSCTRGRRTTSAPASVSRSHRHTRSRNCSAGPTVPCTVPSSSAAVGSPLQGRRMSRGLRRSRRRCEGTGLGLGGCHRGRRT